MMGESLKANNLGAVLAALVTVIMPAPALARATPIGSQIPTNLSVGGMFAQADWVVKLVMIGLIVASVVTWTVFIAKHFELLKARREAAALLGKFASARSLSELPTNADSNALVQLTREELAQSADALDDREGLKERIVSRFDRYEALIARKMTQGVTILATIGATAPFVGLFGTVWGIMNA